MILNFAKSSGIQYSLYCKNNSNASWYFYLYQSVSGQPADVFSLVWMVSPYKIGPGSFMTFIWSLDYSFWWLNTGKLQAGAVPAMGGSTDAILTTNNSTTFDVVSNTPSLSAAVPGSPANQFLVSVGSNIPANVFATGTGRSGFPVLVQQSGVNTVQAFDTNTTFWIVATSGQVQAMQVMGQGTVSNSAIVSFPVNTYNLTATLDQTNLWTIS